MHQTLQTKQITKHLTNQQTNHKISLKTNHKISRKTNHKTAHQTLQMKVTIKLLTVDSETRQLIKRAGFISGSFARYGTI